MQLPSRTALAALLFSTIADAQYLLDEISFGHSGKISPQNNGAVPGFNLQGQPNLPEVLSNRLILTPVQPGNQRGAIWADKALQQETWITDVDFRASGPERGGGNLNIWLANRGAGTIAAGSIYTVGRFEGLAIVIDTHGGTGGMIRGFLNDGSTDFSKSHNIDSLAFGHCFYAYRNLGRPSQIKLRQEEENFRVEIDGNLCFESGKIQIPAGYKFGLTAATPDNPDSWEIFKLVVMADNPDSSGSSSSDDTASTPAGQEGDQKVMGSAEDKPKKTMTKTKKKKAAPAPAGSKDESSSSSNSGGFFGGGGSTNAQGLVPDDPYDQSIPDQDATFYASSKDQFADLHNRLQSVNHHVSAIYRTVVKQVGVGEKRHEEVAKSVADLSADLKGLRDDLRVVRDLKTKLEGVEAEIKSMRKEMGSRLRSSESSIKNQLIDHHSTLKDNIASAAPGHGRLIFVIVASQVVLVGVYTVYKRRKNASPKKYL